MIWLLFEDAIWFTSTGKRLRRKKKVPEESLDISDTEKDAPANTGG